MDTTPNAGEDSTYAELPDAIKTIDIVQGIPSEPLDPPKSFDIRLFPEGLSLKPSPIGVTAGTLAATLAYNAMTAAGSTAASGADATINGIGYVVERTTAYFAGELAGMGVFYTRNALASTAKNTIRIYTPLTAVITSALVGTTTAYAVTAGGALARVAGEGIKVAYKRVWKGERDEQYIDIDDGEPVVV
jgi:hypothetical protein